MIAALLSLTSISAQSSTAATADTIPRKVLVLDFVNQAKDAKSDYLSVSVAEALLDPLKKTGKFYLLPRGGETPPPAPPLSQGRGAEGGGENATTGGGSELLKPTAPTQEGPLPVVDNKNKSDSDGVMPKGQDDRGEQAQSDKGTSATEAITLSPSKGDIPAATEPLDLPQRPTFDETAAIARGKAAGADVVVIGNFVTVKNKVQIQTKAIDVHTGQIAVAKTTSGQLDATVFDLIQKLADDMSTAMAQALPPIPKQVVVTERVGFGLYAKDFRTHLFAGTGLPLGKPNAYLNPGFGGMADLQFEFLHQYFNPYFSFAITNSAGEKSVENMVIFTALGGAAYTFALPWKVPYIKTLSVSPFLAMGASFGTIRAAPDLETQSFSYNVFTLSTGATLDAAITDKISAAFTLRGNYLFESQTPLPVVYMMLGVGYRI